MVLKAYWPLDETSGSTAKDVRGGNDGTVNGPTMGANGILGNTAYDFDSSNNEWVSLDTSNAKPSLPISFTAWIHPQSFTDRFVVVTNDDFNRADGQDYRGAWLQILTDGRIDIGYGDGGGSTSSNRRSATTDNGVVSTGSWQFVSVVFRGATDMDIYYNDTQPSFGYSGSGGSVAYSSANGSIGYGVTDYADGRIADVRVYDHALTQQEVQYLYQVSRRGRLVSGKRQS